MNMMEEIMALQRQLQEAQETKTQNKLSERVVVDLVQAIIKQFNSQLFFSRDGQDYIVPDHLDQQVYEIIQREGRVNIHSLPDFLNIGMEKIENRLDGIQSKYQNITRLEDYLMTRSFLDGIAEEINEELQQSAQVPLAEITSKYEFPLSFIKKLVEDRIGSIIQGNLIAGEKLTTFSFQEIMRAKIRGCLRACTKPQSLATLVNEYKIEKSLINQVVEDLIKHEEIDGKVSGGMFIPQRFVKNQENIIKNFFKQNKYIEYSFLQKQLFIQKPKDFLKAAFKDKCIFLENCCFNEEELKGLQENIEAFVKEEGYTDLSTILPTVLTDQDIDTLIFKHMKLSDVRLQDTYIFSENYIQKALFSFREPIIKILYKSPQKLVAEETGSNANSSSNAAAKKKGKKGGATESKKKQGASKAQLFTEQEIMEHLVTAHIIQQDDRDECFDQVLSAILMPEMPKFYEQIKIEEFENKKSASSEIITELQGKIADLLISLQYVGRGFEHIDQNFSTINLNDFYQRALYAERMLIERIVILFCKKYCVQLPPHLMLDESSIKTCNEGKPYPPYIECGNIKVEKIFKGKAELVAAVELLPKDYSKFLKEAMELYLKRQFVPLLNHLKSNQDTIGVKAILDKKSEKNFTFFIKYTQKEGLKKEMEDELNAKSVFYKILVIYLLEKFNMFFVGNSENEKFVQQQCLVLVDMCEDQQIVALVKQALENFSDSTKLKQLNEEFISLINLKL